MGFAAILIVVFHFWMPLTTSVIEAGIYKCTYLGVDIFFLVSAYSLSNRRNSSYLEFIANRLLNVYVPFVVMAIICTVYKQWTAPYLIKVLCGVEFFRRGGGSFLWFAIAIMLLYLITPFVIRLKDKYKWQTLVIVLALWLLLVCVLQFVFEYTTIFILLNRIPVFLAGLYYEDIRKILESKWAAVVITAGIIFGAWELYKWGGNVRLSKPITDFYYLIAIPLVISIVLLFDFISQKVTAKNYVFGFTGGFTLELYGIQMIFGYDIETRMFRLMKQTTMPMPLAKMGTFLLTASILILLAWLFSIPKKGFKALVKEIRT